MTGKELMYLEDAMGHNRLFLSNSAAQAKQNPRPEAESLRSGNGAAARANLPELLWAALRRKEEKGIR